MIDSKWIDVLSALLTPTIAVCALILALMNYWLSRRKRMDDLFDRRYAFYERVKAIWLTTGRCAAPDEDPEVLLEDLIPIAEEAEFLFGPDIAKHILSLEGPGHTGSPFFPDEAFVRPFKKYLSLG